MRFLQLLSAGLIAYSLILIRNAIPRLPARIPLHFRADGSPNHWGPPQELWHIFAIQVGVTALLLALPLIGRLAPSMVHVGRRKLRELSPASQQEVWDFTSLIGALTALLTNIVITYAIQGIIRAAFEPGRGLPPVPLWIFLGAFLGVCVFALWRVRQLTRLA